VSSVAERLRALLEKTAPAHDAHERGNESSSALGEHHLEDIRAELKAKPPPNYLPNLITAAFPGTALGDQTPLTALSGMGSRVLLAVFPRKKCSRRRARTGTGLLLAGEGCLSGWRP